VANLTNKIPIGKDTEKERDNFISEIAIIFDLLACFDYEDKKKNKLVFNAGSLVSAPKDPALDSKHSE
jgi:hypothetical protein